LWPLIMKNRYACKF